MEIMILVHVHVWQSVYGSLKLIWMDLIPDKLATYKHVESQLDHVPWGRPVILHHVQCHGNMGVTVVTTKVMLKQGKQNITYNLTLYYTYITYFYMYWLCNHCQKFAIALEIDMTLARLARYWEAEKRYKLVFHPPLCSLSWVSTCIQSLSSKNQIKLIAHINFIVIMNKTKNNWF